MALRKFEPERGHRFISYAVWWIKAYIQSYLMRSWSLVKVGTTQAQRKLFFRLRAERALMSEESEAVTDAALATRLGVHVNDVVDMQARMTGRDFSLDAELREDSLQTHLDLLPSDYDDQEEIYARRELEALLRGRLFEAMHTLNDKERYIMIHRLISDEPKTLREVGRNLKISRERARQIEGNVMRKIRTSLEDHGVFSSAA
jgi:RNA polymerase sigma-32 factor